MLEVHDNFFVNSLHLNTESSHFSSETIKSKEGNAKEGNLATSGVLSAKDRKWSQVTKEGNAMSP